MDVSDADEVFVPPMLIQPYIENAVWHGLRYAENKGMLRVSCRSSNENLHWLIEDDGIGRTKSKQMKKSILINSPIKNILSRISYSTNLL